MPFFKALHYGFASEVQGLFNFSTWILFPTALLFLLYIHVLYRFYQSVHICICDDNSQFSELNCFMVILFPNTVCTYNDWNENQRAKWLINIVVSLSSTLDFYAPHFTLIREWYDFLFFTIIVQFWPTWTKKCLPHLSELILSLEMYEYAKM